MSAIAHGRLTFLQSSSRPNRAVGKAPGLAKRIVRTLRVWRRRLQDREALQRLSYRDMRDMGVTPSDISWEVSQPFWREARRR